MVDVADDGHDRRTGLQVLLLLGLDADLQVDVEGVEELALLLLRGDDPDVVAELGAEQPEGVLVEALGRRGHLAEVEQHRDERGRVGVDLVGEVGQGRPLTHLDDGPPVTAGDAHAADRRRLHLLELLALGALGLASTRRAATAAAERTLGAATATRPTAEAATAARTAGEAARSAGATARRQRRGEPPPRAGRSPGRATALRSGIMPGLGRAPAGPRAGGARAGTAGTALRARHPLARRERVVARPRGTALAALTHALARRERVVARPGLSRTGGGTRTRRTIRGPAVLTGGPGSGGRGGRR